MMRGALLAALLLLVPQMAGAVSDEYRSLSAMLVGEADTALTKGETDRARMLLDRALTADPSNARAFALKGHMTRRTGDPEEGVRLMTIGLDIDPTMTDVLVWQGLAAIDLDDFELAARALAQIERLCGTDCAARQELSAALTEARTARLDQGN